MGKGEDMNNDLLDDPEGQDIMDMINKAEENAQKAVDYEQQ